MGIVTIEFMYPTKHTELYIVMFPNSAWPLILHTSPNYYDTFNEIKSYLIFNIRLLLERENQQKVCFLLSMMSRGGFLQISAYAVKYSLVLGGSDFRLYDGSDLKTYLLMRW